MSEKFDVPEGNQENKNLSTNSGLSDIGRNAAMGPQDVKVVENEQSEAYQAGEQALDETPDPENHKILARRNVSEAAAVKTMGGDAVNLDDAVKRNKNLDFKGNNFPTYDQSSSSEISSTKTHWNSDMSWNPGDYKKDLNHMMGWGREVHALDEDAENLKALDDAGEPIPEDLKGATHEERKIYLRDKTLLRIPDDHLKGTKDFISDDYDNLPENYHGLSKEEVMKRFDGIGLTSYEMEEIINKKK